MEKVEIRSLACPELRSNGRRLSGYAAVFDSPSEDMGGWREVIRRGAFGRTLRDQPDIKALVEHNPEKILGRAPVTLQVKEDTRGLNFSVALPKTTVADDALELVRSGILSQMSFEFSLRSDSDQRWSEGGRLREILDCGVLWEISLVSRPAYPATSVAARSGDGREVASVGSYGGLPAVVEPATWSDLEIERERLRMKLQLARRL